MAAPSPNRSDTDLVSFAVLVDGSRIPDSYQVVAIETDSEVNRIPRARITLLDGSTHDDSFAISESASFAPGARIDIALGRRGDDTIVFSGTVRGQTIAASGTTRPQLVIDAVDPALAMTLARGSAVFEKITDSELCTRLIGATAGLAARVTTTRPVHAQIVQYDCTPWDMVLMRAQANSMVVTVAGGMVTVAPPKTTGSPVLTLVWGESILAISATLDAAGQLAPRSVECVAWDPSVHGLARSAGASTDVTTPGNLSSTKLAKVFDAGEYRQQSAAALPPAEVRDWSSATLTRHALAKIRGELRVEGDAALVPGCTVTLAGLGARFDGDAWVSGVSHRLSEGEWTTNIRIGLSPEWFGATGDGVAAPPAAGLLPPAGQLQVGIVKQVDGDPAAEHRVLVRLPLFDGDHALWARIGSFFASSGAGACFLPEVGDEVVLAFMNDDPRYPVILGSLYGSLNPPVWPADGGRARTRALVGRSKAQLRFDEEAPALTLITPRKQRIELDDRAKTVTLEDAHSNRITLDAEGITIRSNGDLTLDAPGTVRIKGDAALRLSTHGSFEAGGGTSASLTSDGLVKVTGSQVKIDP